MEVAPSDFFQDYAPTQAYLKMGLLGFAGDGKSFTSAKVMVGLIKFLQERGLPEGNKPVAFIETETGVDFVAPLFKEAGIPLRVRKTRAFVDLFDAVDWACDNGGGLIIDSITHFWRELCETYAIKKNRKRGLEFQDWAYLKGEWGRFTDAFKDSPCHIIMCGRAGYEYDYFENDAGKRELEKTGLKMKAEAETGYECSLLVNMAKRQDLTDPKAPKLVRVANVLKDRWDVIDGQEFNDPTFESFLPHIELLNLGGKQIGIGDHDSSSLIPTNDDGRDRWEEKKIVLDEIQSMIAAKIPGQSSDDKRRKGDLLKNHFGTFSWDRVGTLDLPSLRRGYNQVSLELTGEIQYAEDGTRRKVEVPNLNAVRFNVGDELELLTTHGPRDRGTHVWAKSIGETGEIHLTDAEGKEDYGFIRPVFVKRVPPKPAPVTVPTEAAATSSDGADASPTNQVSKPAGVRGRRKSTENEVGAGTAQTANPLGAAAA